ncbi:hypothetical protein GF358_04735 [Candidatus Woesearchaeota archaeon]|nr:hypothetical protein [Candidatus Woesearchaeota archaeon]
MGVKEVFVYLENLGLLNVVVPFVIVFIVVHALLTKVKVFSDNKVNAVLAALFAFISIAAADVVANVSLFSYYLVIAVFVIAAILMVIGLIGGKIDLTSDKNKKYASWIVLICLILAVIYAFYRAGIKLNMNISYSWINSVIPLAISVLIFILIIWFITSPGEKTEKARARSEARAEPQKQAEQKRAEEPKEEKSSSKMQGKKVPKWVLEKVIKDLKDKDRIDLSK